MRRSAWPVSSTRFGSGSLRSTLFVRIHSTRSTTRGRLPTIEPSMRSPWLATVAYARASSSGFTAREPSPIEKYASSGLRIPRSCAVLTIAFGPTTSVSCA